MKPKTLLLCSVCLTTCVATTTLLVVACGGEPRDGLADLPPLKLRPALAEFQALVAKAPAPPTKERMLQLRDLLETAFTSSDKRLRSRARNSLLGQADAAWALEWALGHENAGVRSNAAYELGSIGHAPAIPVLLWRLKDEQDAQAKLYLADALARLGNLAALPEIIAAMQDGDLVQRAGVMSVQLLAASARDVGDNPTYARLRTELSLLHRLWLRTGVTLAAVGEPVKELDAWTLARLAKHLVDLEGFPMRKVDEARFVLGRMGRGVVPLLVRAVQAKENYLRQHGMEVLRAVGLPGRPAGRSLRALLRHPKHRAEAAKTLGSVGVREAVPTLLALLRDPDLDVRAAAAESLGPLRDSRAIVALLPFLGDETQPMDLRVMAAFSLALLDPQGKGLSFLLERREKGDYHTPMVDELIARLAGSL